MLVMTSVKFTRSLTPPLGLKFWSGNSLTTLFYFKAKIGHDSSCSGISNKNQSFYADILKMCGHVNGCFVWMIILYSFYNDQNFWRKFGLILRLYFIILHDFKKGLNRKIKSLYFPWSHRTLVIVPIFRSPYYRFKRACHMLVMKLL